MVDLILKKKKSYLDKTQFNEVHWWIIPELAIKYRET